MFYFLCPFFICCLCEKHYKPITGQCYIADCVSWVPRLTLVNRQLNLRMCSQNRTHSYVGDCWRKSQLCIFVPLKSHDYTLRRGFPGDSAVKNLPTMQENWVQSLGQKDPLEKEMATHSSMLAWRIPWTEEPGGLQSMRSQRVRHDWSTNTHTHTVTMFWNSFPYSRISFFTLLD